MSNNRHHGKTNPKRDLRKRDDHPGSIGITPRYMVYFHRSANKGEIIKRIDHQSYIRVRKRDKRYRRIHKIDINPDHRFKEGDSDAIALTNRTGKYKAYIYPSSRNPNNYMLSLENPHGDNDLPYTDPGDLDNIELEELGNLVARHLIR